MEYARQIVWREALLCHLDRVHSYVEVVYVLPSRVDATTFPEATIQFAGNNYGL